MLTRTLLLLLCAFYLALSDDYRIDYAQCGNDKATDCFTRGKCVQQGTDDTKLVQVGSKAELKDGPPCDVFLQIRPFSDSKWHIMMLGNASESNEAIVDSGISLTQGIDQFSCTKNGPTCNTAIFNIEKLGNNIIEDNAIFCSFILKTTDGKTIRSKFAVNEDLTKLTFNGTKEFKNTWNEYVFWTKMEARCNPDMINSSLNSNDEFREEQVDKYAFPPYTCADPTSLMITRENETPTVLPPESLLGCRDGKWTYDKTEIIIPQTEKFNAVCGVRYCTLCPPLDLLPYSGCSAPFTVPISEHCSAKTCPENQWMIDDGRIVNGEVKCMKDKADERKSAWHIESGGESIKISKASCFNKSVCLSTSNFADECPAGDTMECTSFNISSDNTNISCSDGFKLLYTNIGGSQIETPSATCNFLTGLFNDGNSSAINRDAIVLCGRKKEKKVVEQAAAAGFNPIIGVGVGGFVLLIIIAAIIVAVVMRRRKKGSEPKGTEKVGETSAQPTQSTPEPPPAPPAKPRDPWLGRDRFLPVIKENTRITGRMSRLDKGEVYLKEFVYYDFLHRQEIFYSTFGSIDAVHLTLFWRFFKMFEQRNFDCMDMWEMTWRIIRTFDGKLMEADKDDGSRYRKMHERIQKRMIRFALPILTELGWKIRPGELPVDTWMRLFVVRVLLWAEEPSVCKELREQADLPIDKLESPLRAAVFQYAVRHMNRTDELYKKYWMSHVIGDPVDAAADKFGTIRQHLLYGFATNDDKATLERHEKTKKENDDKPILAADTVLFIVSPSEIKKIFTPHDGYWAYLGATEYYTSVDSAIALFSDSIVGSPESTRSKRDKRSNDKMYEFAAIREQQLNEKCKDMTPEQKEEVKKSWMEWSMASICMMAELCTTQKQEHLLADPVLVFKYYCAKLPKQPKIIYDTQMLRELARQWTGHITGKKEDVFRNLEYHFKQCED